MQVLTVPSAPESPIVPRLYHLQTFEGAVTQPWSWNHKTVESFRRAWEESYPKREFEDQLMGCLWWQTSKKVSIGLFNYYSLIVFQSWRDTELCICIRIVERLLTECIHLVQADKNVCEDVKSVRDSIFAAMDLLVASRSANEPYPKLDQVCSYLQWTRDCARFQEQVRIT